MKDHPHHPLPKHLKNIVITDTNMAAREMGTALWVILDIYCICAGTLGNHGYSRKLAQNPHTVKSVTERGGRYFIL
jgi:hypothetical protein